MDSGFELDSLAGQLQALSVKEGGKVDKVSAMDPKSQKARAKQLSQLLKVLHKLRFFLAWVKGQDADAEKDVFSATAEELRQELALLESQRSKAEERRHLVSQPVPQVAAAGPNGHGNAAPGTRKPLIEEISH